MKRNCKPALIFFIIGILGLAAGTASAQVTKLSSKAVFSAEAVLLNFEGQRDGARADELLSQWGVVFLGSSGSIPTIRALPSIIGGADNSVLENTSSGSSASIPLVINFRFPVRRVGMDLFNGTASTQATLTAFDPLGNQLGSVQETGLAEVVFLGLETTSMRGIAKVVVSYGARPELEQIDNLIFDYLSRPTFETVLAQVGDGVFPGGALQTIIVASNLSNSTAQGELKLFGSDGTPLSLTINEAEGSSFSFTLPPLASRTFVSSGTKSSTTAGYAVIRANVPVEATAIFRILDTQRQPVSEAGVSAAAGKPYQVGVVQKVVAGNFNSGLAAVNTGSQAADSRIELFDESGTRVAVDETLLDLAPGGHIARFLTELFPQLENQDFRGTVVITSNRPLALVILRTVNGLVISSLPVGSTQR